MTRVARLAARVDGLEETVTELSARVERLELFTKVPTTPRPHRNGDDLPSGAS